MNQNLQNNLVEAVELLVGTLISSESFKVKQFESVETEILILILVDEEHIGRVIGKKGKIVNSIRSLIQLGAQNINKKLIINIEKF